MAGFLNGQTITFLLIMLLSASVLLLIALFIAYLRLLARVEKMRQDFAKKEEGYLKDLANLRGGLEKQSIDILKESQEVAKRLIQKAQLVTKDYEAKTNNLLDNAIKLIDQRFQESLLSMENKISEMMDLIPVEFEKNLNQEAKDLKIRLVEEVSKVREDSDKAFKEIYQKVENDLDKYKKARIADFEKRFAQILQIIARNVLKKEINPADHEKDVIKAIEEAKAQNVI
ncbi:MAG: hypothetical protein NZM26_05335 [Patescibacteria group bacterium]|nr:hypothetical protein [Patescibacteria group bacterium]